MNLSDDKLNAFEQWMQRKRKYYDKHTDRAAYAALQAIDSMTQSLFDAERNKETDKLAEYFSFAGIDCMKRHDAITGSSLVDDDYRDYLASKANMYFGAVELLESEG